MRIGSWILWRVHEAAPTTVSMRNGADGFKTACTFVAEENQFLPSVTIPLEMVHTCVICIGRVFLIVTV